MTIRLIVMELGRFMRFTPRRRFACGVASLLHRNAVWCSGCDGPAARRPRRIGSTAYSAGFGAGLRAGGNFTSWGLKWRAGRWRQDSALIAVDRFQLQ